MDDISSISPNDNTHLKINDGKNSGGTSTYTAVVEPEKTFQVTTLKDQSNSKKGETLTRQASGINLVGSSSSLGLHARLATFQKGGL